jgi:hypothetical protein
MSLTFDRAINLTTAAGTIGPFLWTVVLYRSELRRRRPAEADAKRRQAAHVTGWVDQRQRPTEETPDEAFLVLHNLSTLPIRNVAFHIIDFHGELHVEPFGFVPPGETIETHPSRFGRAILVPNQAMPLAFGFADAAGNLWFRDWEGALREWPANGDPEWYQPMVARWRPIWAPDTATVVPPRVHP